VNHLPDAILTLQQLLWIYILQPDRCASQRLALQNFARDVLGEDSSARTDEGNRGPMLSRLLRETGRNCASLTVLGNRNIRARLNVIRTLPPLTPAPHGFAQKAISHLRLPTNQTKRYPIRAALRRHPSISAAIVTQARPLCFEA
jgi:hypothetical protein